MNVSRFATLSTRKCARAPSLRTTEEDPLPLMDTELPPQTDMELPSQTDTEPQLQMSTEVLGGRRGEAEVREARSGEVQTTTCKCLK